MISWVICSGEDIYSELVVSRLIERGASCFVIRHDSDIGISLGLDDSGLLRVTIDKNVLPTPQVLWRRSKLKPSVPRAFSDSFAHATYRELSLRISEWRSVLDGVSAYYSHISVQPETNTGRANAKLSQLQIAGRVGFLVPQFIVSNEKEAILEFIDRSGPCIMKALGFPALSDGSKARGLIVTTSIEQAKLADIEASGFKFVPTLVQQKLEKGVEMRVITIRDRVFAYEILGRIEDRAHPDARLIKPNYRQITPSSLLEELCVAYVKSAGLRYGVFDLVSSPDSHCPYFLECNPEGQWQSALGINIESVVDNFCELMEEVACVES